MVIYSKIVWFSKIRSWSESVLERVISSLIPRLLPVFQMFEEHATLMNWEWPVNEAIYIGH